MKEEIIRMGTKAGLLLGYPFTWEQLERFADLVRADEREACAALVDANAMACENPIYRSLLQANAAAIRDRDPSNMPLFDDWNKDWK